jgi:hypothetical protein
MFRCARIAGTAALLLCVTAGVMAGCRGPASEAEQVRDLLLAFTEKGANQTALTRQLRPSPQDYQAIFADEALAAAAVTKYEDAWKGGRMVIAPAAGETKVKIWAANVEELRRGVHQFPTGYLFTSMKMRTGLTFYRFMFHKPDKKEGTRDYEGLVRVNGRFVLVPQAWRLLPRNEDG